MLIINDDEARALLPMDEVIGAMEDSYREVAEGSARNLPRGRIRQQLDDEGLNYFFNCIPGFLRSRGVMAVRLDSAVREFNPERAHVRYLGDQYCGWVILFSIWTGEPLAIMDDFSLSGIRVGATVGVGMKYLARADARRVALYGSGKQARSNLEAVSKVRRLEEVRVYSPNPAHRALFVQEMTDVVGAEIVGVDSPQKAMDGADIVLCTASSMTPVFDGNWLRPGMAVSSISSGNDSTATEQWKRVRREIDDLTIERSDRIVISSRQQALWDHQTHLWDPDRPSDKVAELGEVLVGSAIARNDDAQIALFANNTGTGNQFAAAGAIVYENARKQGVGREIPTEWLMMSMKKWAELGFYPSP